MALLLKVMHYLDKHFLLAIGGRCLTQYVWSDNMSNTLLEGNSGQSF